MNEAQDQAIADRAAWANEMNAMISRFVEELTPLALRDYAHQTGPRGVESYKAYLEVSEELTFRANDLAERVKQKVQRHMIDQRWERISGQT